MRKFLAISGLAIGVWAPVAWAPVAWAQNDGYETQKTKLQATRYESLAMVRALGKNASGRVVELRGQVKGSFARGASRALLFQIAENENVVIEAPENLKSAATMPGATARFLCRVESVRGADVALTLLAASDAPDPAQLFKADNEDLVVAPPDGETLPPPEQIMIGADEIEVPLVQGAAPTPKSAPKARKGNVLPSRSLPRTAQSARTISPFFGFDESQRAAYKTLARRNNPKLSEAMADTIAVSILNAAQAHSLDPRFLAAIVTVESSFDPYCLSSSGAMGLGQLMPFNLRPLGVSNAWDPGQNLRGSAKLLRQNLDIYARQPNGTLLAVAAYHAGVGAVNRAGKAVPPRASTQKYVWKVYYAYRALAPELFPR